MEYAGQPRLKLSAKQQTLIGRKQGWPAVDAVGAMQADVITLREEAAAVIAAQLGVVAEHVEPRLAPVMWQGRAVDAPPSLAMIRERCTALRQPAEYPVRLSNELEGRQVAATAAARTRLLAGDPQKH